MISKMYSIIILRVEIETNCIKDYMYICSKQTATPLPKWYTSKSISKFPIKFAILCILVTMQFHSTVNAYSLV